MNIEIDEDDALVLFEYLERIDETEDLSYIHVAEYLVLAKIHAQVTKGTAAMFKNNYEELLSQARERIGKGYEGNVPCLISTEK